MNWIEYDFKILLPQFLSRIWTYQSYLYIYPILILYKNMKRSLSFLTPFLFAITLVACGPSKTPDQSAATQPEPEGWEKRPYEVSELVMMFQDWVPEQYLAGKFVWASMNVEWEKYKQTDHNKIKLGNYDIAKSDSNMTPAIYLASIVGTIDDRSFFTPEWPKNADNWFETMVVNYSDEKCADQTAILVEKYINQDKLKPEFKVHKERWMKELKKIATQ